jgi:hypothetical protein
MSKTSWIVAGIALFLQGICVSFLNVMACECNGVFRSGAFQAKVTAVLVVLQLCAIAWSHCIYNA